MSPAVVLLVVFSVLILVQGRPSLDVQGRLREVSLRHFDRLQRSETQRLIKQSRDFLVADGLNFSALSREHNCEHDAFIERSGIAKAYSNDNRKKFAALAVDLPDPKSGSQREKRQTSRLPIRMYMDTSLVSTTDSRSCQSAGATVIMEDNTQYSCRAADVLTPGKVALIDNLMDAIAEGVKQMIQVNQVSGNLILPSSWFDNYALGYNCRRGVPVSRSLTTTGIANTDYYMFVLARPLGSTGVLANAAPCAHNILSGGVLDRPLAGSINFNPGSDLINNLVARPSDAFLYDQVFKLGLHEVTHALGFTGSLYGDYRTPPPSSGLYGGTYGPAKTFSRTGAPYSLYWMTSPRVQAYARAQFNCPTLGGMELEEGDPSPSQASGPGSHWEKRLVGNEYMSPVASPAMVVSKLTLSLFEDMGWYDVNYTYADPSYWGSGAGCSFATEECSSSTWGRYFCSNQCSSGCNTGVCNGDRSAVGYCDAVRYSTSLPTYYQHFSDPALGGSSKWFDYCPVIAGYSNRFCKDPAAQIAVQGDGYGEAHTSIAACFDITVSGRSDAGCYEKQCTTSSGGQKVLQVKVGNNQHECTTGGQQLQVSGPVGSFTLTCPDVEFFCADHLVKSGSTVPWTYNPADSVPLPTDPFGNPPGGAVDPNLQLVWGSTLVWVLLAIGILLAVVIIVVVCCICCQGKGDGE